MACDDHACSKLSKEEHVEEEVLSSTACLSNEHITSRENPPDGSSSLSCDTLIASADEEAAGVKSKGPVRIASKGSAKEIRLFGVDLKEQAHIEEVDSGSHQSSAAPPLENDASADQQSGCSSDMGSRVAPHAATTVKNWPLRPFYACNFCDRKFVNCQALGGHQNAHKRQRQKERRGHIQAPSRTKVGKVSQRLSRHFPSYKQTLALSSPRLPICTLDSHALVRGTQDCPKKEAHKAIGDNMNIPSLHPFEEFIASSLSNSNVPKPSRSISLNHTSNICPNLVSYEHTRTNESLLMATSRPKTSSFPASTPSVLTTSPYMSSCTIPPISTMPSPFMFDQNPILHQSFEVHSFPNHGYESHCSHNPSLDLQLTL